MKTFDLHYVYWLLGRLAKALSMWGLLGILLAVASGLFYLGSVVPAEQKLLQAQNELDNTKKALVEKRPELDLPQTASTQTSAEEIAEFYKLFPAGASLPKWLRLIEESAAKQRLVLKRGDYKLTQSKQGQLQRYEIVLPLAGKYSQIRQFIADVMQKSPALALKDMQIKRENTLSPTVEARLVFVLFLQGNSWLK
jgi:Tfp pilus assembly protein PilO